VYRYLLNYMPFGFVYKLCSLLPIKLAIVALREVFRAKQIHMGFMYASTKFPDCPFVIGTYAIVLGL